jgi:hypothetical protein
MKLSTRQVRDIRPTFGAGARNNTADEDGAKPQFPLNTFRLFAAMHQLVLKPLGIARHRINLVERQIPLPF